MPKKIIIISAVYPPEPVVSAQTSSQIAEMLAQNNHTVTVVTGFPSRPAGKLFPGFSRKFTHREQTVLGIEIVRCFSTLSPESRLFSRLLENLSFGLTSGWQVLTLKRPQVIYSNTWPIFATGIITLIAAIRRIPVVISVQDVYPESLIVQGRIDADSLLARTMRWIDKWIAHSAQAVIVISQSFRKIYIGDRQVSADKVYFVPNWMASDAIDVTIPQGEFRKQLDIPQNAFVFAYGGNVGMAAGVEDVIKAFSKLQNANDLFLLIAGDGSRMAASRKLADEAGNKRILFYTPWPQDETSSVLRSANILLLPTKDKQSLASVPSKLITYMLAARPVLAMALPQTDLSMIIKESGCGWVVEPGQFDLLAEKMRSIAAMPRDELSRRGQAGRDYALRHFTRDATLPRVMAILDEAVKTNLNKL